MDDYTEGLRQSYYGEIVAEGFYRRLALAEPEGYRRTALSLIADVEHATQRRLAPFAAALGITLTDEDRDRRIRTRIQDLGQFDWDVFIRKAHREWPAYLDHFEHIERVAQTRGEHGLKFLVDHERALLDFVHLELASPRSHEALLPLRSYIAAEARDRQ
jgi:hypothetical protein